MKKRIFIIISIILAAIVLLFMPALGFSLFSLNRMLSGHTSASAPNEYIHAGAQEEAASVDYENAYNGTDVPDVITPEIQEKYLSYQHPADDEFDFRYATDYSNWSLVKLLTGRDCSANKALLGYEDATLEQIHAALQANSNINEKYKSFIYDFACDLRALYPNVNLAGLYHNLQTLVIKEMTQAQIDRETLSTNSAACYLRYDNQICVLEDLNLSRESDDYIILVHELCHAARSVQMRPDPVTGNDVDIGFYDYYRMGTYAEEGIITNIAYELQGLGQKATFYPMLSSYYRIICSCIGYSGEEFFNHSVNHLIDKMDAFMGDEEYAYQIVAMIDAQMSLRYTPYAEVDFRNFQPMYEYLARMYFKKHIAADMSYADALAVFDAFYREITFHFENMNRKYAIDENTFLPTFEAYTRDLGIFPGAAAGNA